MEAAKDTFAGDRLILLDESRVDSQRREFFPMIGLEEGAARIFEDLPLNRASRATRSRCASTSKLLLHARSWVRLGDDRNQRRWL